MIRFLLLSILVPFTALSSIENDTVSVFFQKNNTDYPTQYYHMSEYYQNVNIDSAYKYVQMSINYSKKEKNTMIELKSKLLKSFLLYNYGKKEESHTLLDSTYQECLRSDFNELKIIANNYKGREFAYKGEFDTAIQYFKNVLDLSIEYKDSLNTQRAQNNIGSVYLSRGLYRNAMEYFLQALQMAESLNDTKSLITLYTNIGTIHQTNSEFEKAIDMYKKAENIAIKNNNIASQAMIQNNLGVCYRNTGDSELYLKYAKNSLESYKSLSDINGESIALSNIGYAYWYLNNTPMSLKFLNEAEQKSMKIENKANLISIYQFKSNVLLNNHREDEALPIIKKGLQLSKDQKVLQMETTLTDYLRWYYEIKEDFSKAYKYQREYHFLYDSLLNGENKDLMTRLIAEYESDNKEKENQLLRIQNELNEKELYLKNRKNHYLILLLLGLVITILFILRLLNYRNSITRKLSKLNNKLQKSNNTKDLFFSILSHDLRSPFTAMLGFSDLAVKKLQLKPELKTELKYVQIINDSSRNTLKLLNNILEWANSQQGNIKFKPQLLVIEETQKETFELLNHQAHKKGIIIKREIEPDLSIYADEQMFTFILRNIVGNAIKFSDKGQYILIKAYRNETSSIVEIKDQGVGMDSETLKNLFKIEHRKSMDGTQKEKGSGMGLILCKEFMDYHKGQINVSSKLNEGTIFQLTFTNK